MINYEKNYEDLSDEDLALKQQLELCVDRVLHSDPEQQKVELESMRQQIRDATNSMTVLKFLHPHYGTLQSHYEKTEDSDLKKILADLLSFLALTTPHEGERASLKYKLLGSYGDDADICSWGQEYVMNLAREISQELQSDEAISEDLPELVEHIIPILLKYNAVLEAIDLSLECENSSYIDLVASNLDDSNYERTCLYLTTCTKYLSAPDANFILETAWKVYMRFKDYPRALRIALRMKNDENVDAIFTACHDILEKKQFCFILARHGVDYMGGEGVYENDEEMESLEEIIDGSYLQQYYLDLAHDIDVKEPNDIYEARGGGETTIETVEHMLAATFVNAFVNAGFLEATTTEDEWDESYFKLKRIKDKEHVKVADVASWGMHRLWDADSELFYRMMYKSATGTHFIAGTLLGFGIANCHVKYGLDYAKVQLVDNMNKKDSLVRIGSIMGLGLAFAGSQVEDIGEELMAILRDGKSSLDVMAFSAVSLGLICMGSGYTYAKDAIIDAVKDRSESELEEPLIRFSLLGLGLVYLGKQDRVDAAGIARTFKPKIRKYCETILLSCAYAGTGDVLKIQSLLGQCTQHHKNGETDQGPAVLGIAMVAMAEEVGLVMAIRSLKDLLQCGELNIRRAVPLALGLLYISNPKVDVVDTLSVLSHDGDTDVAMAAIISLGLIGAGTNNYTIAGMLRNLSSSYYKDGSLLFSVRIAQGLVHMGKGLLTLSPYHSERFLLSTKALAGVATMLHACLDMKAIILGKYPFVLYFLALAMQPRMLMTLDEEMEPLSVPVRVGQAVDVVGQPGQPKTITGFRTLSTPILLSAGDRAELGTKKYIPLSPILEGLVVLRENPEYMEDH